MSAPVGGAGAGPQIKSVYGVSFEEGKAPVVTAFARMQFEKIKELPSSAAEPLTRSHKVTVREPGVFSSISTIFRKAFEVTPKPTELDPRFLKIGTKQIELQKLKPIPVTKEHREMFKNMRIDGNKPLSDKAISDVLNARRHLNHPREEMGPDAKGVIEISSKTSLSPLSMMRT